MAIINSPPAIIFINDDLSTQVLSVFVRQLFITEVLDASTFDGYIAADGYWAARQLADGYRILVLRNLFDLTNRNNADMVLFAKAGLVSVECNKIGPPNITLPINQVYLTALIELQKCFKRCCFCHHCHRCDYYDLFVGQKHTRDYNPFHLDPPCLRDVEPVN